jgi:uncharacterized membrane protein
MSLRRCLLVLACVLWCALLAVSRRVHSGDRWSMHLVFNTGLAAAPLLLSGLALRCRGRALWPMLAAWLVVFPNAPYLFSELVHLRPRSGAPFAFDLVLLCSVAGAGLMFTLISLDDVHRALARRSGELAAWAWLTPALFASGFALSLGRLQRWNSWDVLREPRALVWDAFAHMWDPRAVATTLGFGVLLTLVHGMARELGRAREAERTS